MGIESLIEGGIKTAMQSALTTAKVTHPAFRCFWLNDTTDPEKPEEREMPLIAIVASPNVPDGVGSIFRSVSVEIVAMTALHDDPKRASLVALWEAAIAPIYSGSVTVSGYTVSGIAIEESESTVDDLVNAMSIRATVHVCASS